jgi:hypothetical protein
MKIEKYKDKLIAFDFDSETVNATDMLKAFPNKRMSDFLSLKATKEYTEYLKSKTGIPVLTVKHGGTGHGTWMHRKLAYDFAAWLSVDFKDFIYEIFDSVVQERLDDQQRQLDYFWDREDHKDLYRR